MDKITYPDFIASLVMLYIYIYITFRKCGRALYLSCIPDTSFRISMWNDSARFHSAFRKILYADVRMKNLLQIILYKDIQMKNVFKRVEVSSGRYKKIDISI